MRAQCRNILRAPRSYRYVTHRCISNGETPTIRRVISNTKHHATSTALNDHREIGSHQKLFVYSKYSPGSPLLLPNGTKIFLKLFNFLRAQYEEFGFEEVISPNIYKKSLWEKSGHWDNFADDMYMVTGRGASGTQQNEQKKQNEEYGLKPMNCPGHCLIFASKSHSYRDLPVRYADFSSLHRNEVAGALSGLTRVRRFHQDDGHIFCRPSQIKEEIHSTLEFVKLAYRVLGLGPYKLVLSTRPKDNFIGSIEEWDNAEAALTETLHASGLEWSLNEGDGAFYGPKIDIMLTDANGKQHQTATIQLDFQMPKRFELKYQAPSPEQEQMGLSCTDAELLKVEGPVTPVLIHRAIFGSIERIVAILMEHYEGYWPFWLNPNQVAIITVNDSLEVMDYALQTKKIIQGKGESKAFQSKRRSERGIESDLAPLSVSILDRPVSVGSKIASAKGQRFGVILTIGPAEVNSQTISVDFSGIPIRNQYTNEILQAAVTTPEIFTADKNVDTNVQADVSDDVPFDSGKRATISASLLRSALLELQRAYC
ncbi:putative threonine--tRNA ligase [Podosphaera aphanis]|nr:putative threonine--tRNA ligase [Podosphaera aphanis]